MPGTYERVPSDPVNLFDAMVALPVGMAEAASVIFLVFLIGGAFTVVDETGSLRRATLALIRALNGRDIQLDQTLAAFVRDPRRYRFRRNVQKTGAGSC